MNLYDYTSATDLANDIKAKKLSPVEVMESTIALIEKRNASINAFTFTAFDEAMEKAKAAEKALMAGEAKGSFFGVPTAAKDFLPGVLGWPGTSGGVKAVSHLIDDHNSLYTQSMIDEGAIFVGKTNSPSFAFRGTCDNLMYGPTSTPFKVGYNSGGSSGGSAAAVADGMLLIAEGTDGGGSIRIPAAWCGLYGFKAGIGTIGTAPRPDLYGMSHCYAWDGAMTRTVKDAAHAIQAMAGFDPFDPYSLDLKHDFIGALDGSVEGWKIAYTPDWGIFPVDPEIEAMVEKAAYAFEEAGATVERVDFGLTKTAYEYAEAWCTLISISGMESFEDLKKAGIDLLKDYPKDIPDELKYWIHEMYKLSLVEYCDALLIRSEVFETMQRVFQDYDLIISPTTVCKPVKNDPNRNTTGPSEMNGQKVETQIGWCETFFCNFTGSPAASIPAGLSQDGFPVGMQIIGRRFHDEDVITASAVFEKLRPWASTYEIPANRPIG